MCLEKGIASRDDIDKTMKLGMNHPMGPLQLGTFSSLSAHMSRIWHWWPLMLFYNPNEPLLQLICKLSYDASDNDFSLLIFQSIGLDTCLAIQQTLYQGTGDSKYRPSILLERMVDAQWYGRKNGKGFYEYDNSSWKTMKRSPMSKYMLFETSGHFKELILKSRGDQLR